MATRKAFIPPTLLILAALLTITALLGASPALAKPQSSLCAVRYYNIVWDGWTGKLVLCFQDGEGSYLQQGTVRHQVRYIEGQRQTGYDHRLVFWVDFAGTPTNPNDDQRFEGYHLTQQPSWSRGMAGLTWWNNIPFGFYATRTSS